MCSRSGLMSHFFLLSILWDVLQVHTSPDMFALVASIKCLRVLYFILSDVQSAAMASREAMVPATFPQCRSELTVLKLQIPLTSCLVSVSTSPAALTWTWTVTPTRRTIMTGIVRKPRPLAHVCLCVGAGGGLFIPPPH